LDFIGFQSRNIGDTRISGLDISSFLQRSGKLNHQAIIGYTYIVPTQLGMDSAKLSNYSSDENFLKYRNAHTVKLSWDIGYKKWTIASINTMNSAMVNIDAVFANSRPSNVFTGLFDYGTSPTNSLGDGLGSTVKKHRDLYNTWYWIGDIRLSYQATKAVKFAIVAKNIGNTEYMPRPGIIGPMRNFTIQVFADL
jgi:outer membrane receptor protein involved in Fe transport